MEQQTYYFIPVIQIGWVLYPVQIGYNQSQTYSYPTNTHSLNNHFVPIEIRETTDDSANQIVEIDNQQVLPSEFIIKDHDNDSGSSSDSTSDSSSSDITDNSSTNTESDDSSEESSVFPSSDESITSSRKFNFKRKSRLRKCIRT
jgi:hypothetical protein